MIVLYTYYCYGPIVFLLLWGKDCPVVLPFVIVIVLIALSYFFCCDEMILCILIVQLLGVHLYNKFPESTHSKQMKDRQEHMGANQSKIKLIGYSLTQWHGSLEIILMLVAIMNITLGQSSWRQGHI